MNYWYGIDTHKINITQLVYSKCTVGDVLVIPKGSGPRDFLFTDPLPLIHKYVYIEHLDSSISKYSEYVEVTINGNIVTADERIFPVIVAIGKLEKDYIKEFVLYHLALGFKEIYIYDNEDTPVYNELLYYKNVIVTHIPGKGYNKPVQLHALDHFITKYMRNGIITHVAHIDIDEFIVLKKHSNITDFVKDYIYADTAGIGMNWVFFGNNGLTEYSSIPLTQRFTKCQENADSRIKTLFNVDSFVSWKLVHCILPVQNTYVKSTNGSITNDAYSHTPDTSVIQLNHYKCKTLPEFTHIRTRGRADLSTNPEFDENGVFDSFNFNEITDLTAANFYKSINEIDFIDHNKYLKIPITEGYSSQLVAQVADLKRLCKNAKTVLEIGFNAGHSAITFLESGCTVLSFDLGEHSYVHPAKEYIDLKFPGKHRLVLGDSTQTIPKFPTELFDLIFIDGGHSYSIAQQDTLNCMRFAHPGTILVVDDIVYDSPQGYTVGPTAVWESWKKSHQLVESGHSEYSIGRGMSWGKYSIIGIVYYIYINPQRNWKEIVEGQLRDLLFMEIPSDLHIHICCEQDQYIDECKQFIKSMGIECTFYVSTKNQYEYPGLLLLYNLAKIDPDKIFLYIHTKGMVFSSAEHRTDLEKSILRNTICDWKKCISLFTNKNINKIGLFPSDTGSIWFNFFWVRGSYIKNPPIVTTDRFYYERYIGLHANEESGGDCYSLYDNKIKYYPQPEVVEKVHDLSILHLSYFDFLFEYGTYEYRIVINRKVRKYCFKNGVIVIPAGDLTRASLFSDPIPGVVKSIFINNKEYKEYSKIIIYGDIFQIDQVPDSVQKYLSGV